MAYTRFEQSEEVQREELIRKIEDAFPPRGDGSPGRLFEQFFDFRKQAVLNAIKIQALQLDHAVAVPACKFLNPMAYRLLAILNFVVQRALDKSPLDFHIALHIERHAVSTNKLLQQHQQAKIVVFVIVNELP